MVRRRRHRLDQKGPGRDAFGPQTRRTASSALLPAPTRNPTPTRLPLPWPTPSSPMLLSILTTTPYGGKGLTRIRPNMLLTGRASRGTARPAPRRALIPTPVLPRPQSSAPAFPRNLTIPQAFRCPPSSSAADAQRPLRWFYQSFNWEHGTFVGSIMASETTAAATGAVGVVRRDPMAMLPFCGYNMGDYFAHWLEMGKTTPNLPKIFHVNWFRLTDDGKFLWPGFGDNFRVLEWIIKRCEDKVGARETEIGYIPYADDINLEGLNYEIEPGRKFCKADLESILTVEKDYWLDDFNSVKECLRKDRRHDPRRAHQTA